jgi:hypothetical protein
MGGICASGNPNMSKLPQWRCIHPLRVTRCCSTNDSRVVRDPDRVARLAMEQVLKLS